MDTGFKSLGDAARDGLVIGLSEAGCKPSNPVVQIGFGGHIRHKDQPRDKEYLKGKWKANLEPYYLYNPAYGAYMEAENPDITREAFEQSMMRIVQNVPGCGIAEDGAHSPCVRVGGSGRTPSVWQPDQQLRWTAHNSPIPSFGEWRRQFQTEDLKDKTLREIRESMRTREKLEHFAVWNSNLGVWRSREYQPSGQLDFMEPQSGNKRFSWSQKDDVELIKNRVCPSPGVKNFLENRYKDSDGNKAIGFNPSHRKNWELGYTHENKKDLELEQNEASTQSTVERLEKDLQRLWALPY